MKLSPSFRKIPLIVISITIIYFSLNDGPESIPLFPHIDKVQHFIAYSALGFSIYLFSSRKSFIIILTIWGVVLGMGLEFVQGTLPYRDMSIGDLVANCFGLFLGSVSYQIIYTYSRKRV